MMATYTPVLLALIGFLSLCSGARYNGPIVLSLYNPIFPIQSVNLVLPNTIDSVLSDPTKWTAPTTCLANFGKLTWALPMDANMTGTDGNVHPLHTFGVFYNANDKLTGFVHVTLSNMSYDYENGAVYWIHIPENSEHVFFDFPVEQWIHLIHLEPTANICNPALAMPKTFSGAGDVILINNVPTWNATQRRYPYNKTDARMLDFVHSPTGDACIPMMGCHWFDPTAGTPIYPQWVAGFDVYGDLQFTEVMTTSPQPIYKTQWELVPAGAIPEFGNINWYFRHVHVKDPTTGCANVCEANRDDCHPLADCQPDLSQVPYFRCKCPRNDSTIVTFNAGRGPNGCTTCPIGKVPSVDRLLCVDACRSGYFSDPFDGHCVDEDDCPMAACASDETCINLQGNPYACIFSQIANTENTWTAWIISKNISEISDVLGDVTVLNFAVGKRSELILTLADPSAVVDADAGASFATASGANVVGVFDSNQRLVIKLRNIDNVNVHDATDNAITLLASASSVALIVLALLF
jgi:hypothetical protein